MSLLALVILLAVVLVAVAVAARRIDPFVGLVCIVGLVIVWYAFAAGDLTITR